MMPKMLSISVQIWSRMVTLSPIFESPGKGDALGLERLRDTCRVLSIPVIALGGVTDEAKIEGVRQAGAEGFASIRYFTK